MARFRNLLAHLHGDVGDERVLEIARTRPDDLTRFQQVLATRATTG